MYAGAADGGVWRSTDRGAHWTPLFDDQSNLAIGAVAVNPADHSVWVGHGRGEHRVRELRGRRDLPVHRPRHALALVGGRLDNSLVSAITFDGLGHVLVSTSSGMLRRSATNVTAPWQTVLKPDPNPTGSPYRTSFFTDVDVRPGTGGHDVLAVLGWRGGTLPADTSFNGFYVSHNSGAAGIVDEGHAQRHPGRDRSGAPPCRGRPVAGTCSPSSRTRAPSPSAACTARRPATRPGRGPRSRTTRRWWTPVPHSAQSGGDPGSQAWYDQYVQVDPSDPAHVYLGLEEVFETSDSRRDLEGHRAVLELPAALLERRPGARTPAR